ncbi:MAG TPA: pyridoxamine 5'-phosphate oxidase [Marmoricola sp.]|nr:pyridoxamine 5'-phosphate oxidase [Marmoricola sp.]
MEPLQPPAAAARTGRPDLSALREEYRLGGLAEDDLDPDPFAMFDRWMSQAVDAGLHEANAMVLTTVGPDGAPSSRSVLLKQVTDRGFCFYTNRESRKGRELAADPRCALLVPWWELQRQVRVEGVAEPLSRVEDEAYFATRPRDSQIGAWASAQSRVVSGRAELEEAYDAAVARFDGQEVPCPPYWGGFVVVPHTFEFWQGRRGRMHDRLVYRRSPGTWSVERLAP